MKWDRKKKRFTSGDQVGADNKKMIRSESGALLPASYNSGRYREWKQTRRKSNGAPGLSAGSSGPDNGILPAQTIYRNRKEKEKVCALSWHC
jgi:ATP-dependent RNA helicase DDX54/DBP10